MFCSRSSLVLTLGVPLVLASPADASEKDCTGTASLKDNPVVGSAKITSTDKKTPFIKSEMDDKSCPAETAACVRKAFLVPGNTVLVSSHTGNFACATYVNGKGVETNGWLPNTSVVMDAPATDPKAQDWLGTWIREEAKVTIKTDAKGALAVHGDATFGSMDPQRVKTGAVNMGEMSGVVTATGGRLSFAMGDGDKTLPVEKGDDTMCKIWMQRAGDYLLVDDNNVCGGMNVSFRGTYVRR